MTPETPEIAKKTDSIDAGGPGEAPLRIDLQEILRRRVSPSRRRWIPRLLVRGVERLVCQERLNDVLRYAFPARGTEFAEKVLRYLNVKTEVRGADRIPPKGRFVFASNHPLGALDGIALIAVLGARYGDEDLYVPVNDLLLNVRPLDNIFVGINKYGRQGRRSARDLNSIWEGRRTQIAIFPAGLVSRLGKKGRIADLEWRKYFAAKALQYDRDIIPVYVEARNTMRFYRAALWRKRLHIPFNLEQALLPSEVFKAQGSTVKITFGTPISIADARRQGLTPGELAAIARRASDELAG